MFFDLPDLAWWVWALVAVGGAFLAWFVAKSSNAFASFVAVAIAVLAAMCGVLAIFVWIKG
jgi:hypothetical protein